MGRSSTIDILRGVAVIIMIFANTTQYFIDLSNQNFVRFIFSLTAPVFLVITGYVTEILLNSITHSKKKITLRIFQILFFAIIIDLVFWKAMPFVTFDILYLIAASQLFLILINKRHQFAVVLIVLIGTLVMHAAFEYRFDIPDLTLDNLNQKDIVRSIQPLKRFLFDGWFPIFPWLGFVFLGAIGRQYYAAIETKKNYFLLTGLFLLIIMILVNRNIQFLQRDFYLEIWYPATGVILLIPLATFLIIAGLISRTIISSNIFINFIIILGRNSLFVYVFNALLIALVLDFKLNNSSIDSRYVLLIVILTILTSTLLIERFRRSKIWPIVPKGIKFLLGYQ